MKTHTLTYVVLFALLFVLTPAPTHAALDAFLKIASVEGESREPAHEDEIEILSWSWGASNPGRHDGQDPYGHENRVVRPFVFRKAHDKASPKLFRAAFTDEPLDTPDEPVRLIIRKTYGEGPDALTVPFMEIRLSEGVHVVGYEYEWGPDYRDPDVDGDGIPTKSSTPTESLSFSYGKIEITYSPRGQDGRHIGLGSDADVSVEILAKNI